VCFDRGNTVGIMEMKDKDNTTTEQQLANYIIAGGKFTLCPPQKVTRKMRIRNLGMKNQLSSKKGSLRC
jgi:hypothetical protein